jgi:hypothetical protein
MVYLPENFVTVLARHQITIKVGESMKSIELFDILLEGNPNSLGRVLEVMDMLHQHQITPKEVYRLYHHENSIVSMRVSNVLKRLWREDKSIVLPLVDMFISDAKVLTNATFRWTIAQMVDELYSSLSTNQIVAMGDIIFENLTLHDDWIVLTQSLKACQKLIKKKVSYPNKSTIIHLTHDSRKAVVAQANKVLDLY